MNAGWKTKTLGEVSDFQGGSQPPKSQFVDQPREGYVRLLQIRDFKSDKWAVYVPVAKGNKLCQETDIMIGRYGASVGQIHRGKAGAYNVALIRTIPNLQLIEREFFYHYLNSDLFQKPLFSVADRSAQAGFSKDDIAPFPIPIPPLDEQRRIVTVLDKAFSGIATATANAQKNLTNARALFESYLQSAFDRNSCGWSSYYLGDGSLIKIIDGDRGTNYPNKSDFSDSGHCLFLNTKNVRPDGFNFDATMFVSKQKDGSLRKGKLSRSDVIMTTRGTIGNLALYDESVGFEHVRINSGMLIFRPNCEKILPRYLFEILRSGIIKKQIAENVSGAAQPQLPIHTLVKFKIPVPEDLGDQGRIVQGLAEIESATNKLEQVYHTKLAALVELKQSLLQKAFAGELT